MLRKQLHAVGPNLEGKRVVVVGLGKSGKAAVELLQSRGAEVVGTDSAPESSFSNTLTSLRCRLVLGGHEGVDFNDADLIVVSPGVPNFPQLREAEEHGAEVIGETELASRYLDVPVIAVGGTNGKSTTTVLLGHLLEATGRRVFVGGNLGDPACEAPDQDLDLVVLEVSSFQMERVPTFRPQVSLLLNLGEDHLDRYDSFEAYVAAKGGAFQNQMAEDVAIYLQGCERCRGQVSRGKAKLLSFGAAGDYRVEDRSIVEAKTGEVFDLSGSDLHGRHNYFNAAAAIAAARVLGVSADDIAEGLRRFRPLPHRMALAGRVGGVSFYDDSKATNVEAAVTALLGLSEARGVLVAGGKDKLGSYGALVEALAKKGRAAVLLGEAGPRLAEAIGHTVPIEHAKTMEGAVFRAFRMARPGDAVLLSPACSSLDMFKNYSERGDRFTEAVERLARTASETD